MLLSSFKRTLIDTRTQNAARITGDTPVFLSLTLRYTFNWSDVKSPNQAVSQDAR